MVATVFYLLILQSVQSKIFWKKIYPLCLGNIPGDFPANYMKKTVLNGCVYDFSFDYRAYYWYP